MKIIIASDIHGSAYYCKMLLQAFKGEKADRLINGHTHVPKCEKSGDFIFMNCGSVSIPKENSPHSYITLENGEFNWKNLENGEVYKSYKTGGN